MKRFIVGMMAVTGLLGFTGLEASAQAPRLGFINSQRIMAEAPGTAEANAAFQQSMQQFQQELQTMEQELETEQSNIERQRSTLTEAALQTALQSLQQKVMAYQQRQQEMEQQAQQRQAELVQPIMEKIQTVIEELRVEGNYALIFDTAAGSIITADPALDLTQQVLDRLAATP